MSMSAMTSNRSKLDSLEKLQSPDQLALLDAIDDLRKQDLGNYGISIPQLIVCGDQSSGKSSVLERITRLPFPAGQGTCTTFATELALRRGPLVSINCTIHPSHERGAAQKAELRKFKMSYTARENFEFESVLKEAEKRMKADNSSKFHKDVLQIDYTGPDLPSLTVVDLPGFVRTEDEAEVLELVKSYMRNGKSIILAIVTAHMDLDIQGVIKFVKEVDEFGHRSLGIVTRPDTLIAGSENEAKIIRLVKNQIHRWELGWHVVRNRGGEDRRQDKTNAVIDEAERQFFSEGLWRDIQPNNVGIDKLRGKLSSVLLRHIRNELPSLIDTIQVRINVAEVDLRGLGEPRESEQDLVRYMLSKAAKFQILTNNALDGTYHKDELFSETLPKYSPASRLRTEISNLNSAFSSIMYQKGRFWQIYEGDPPEPRSVSVTDAKTEEYNLLIEEPKPIEILAFFKDEVAPRVYKSQSGEISSANSHVIAEIFREQSSKWDNFAQHHLDKAFQAVRDYLEVSLHSLMSRHSCHALLAVHINAALAERKERMDVKLRELLSPYREHIPRNYDLSFATQIRASQASRHSRRAASVHDQSAVDYLPSVTSMEPTYSDILDKVQAYYERAKFVFIENVTVLAVECFLLADLASIIPIDTIIMNKDQLHAIASEAEDIRAERAALKQKLKDLKAGKRILDMQAYQRNSASLPRPGLTLVPMSRPHQPQVPEKKSRDKNAETEMDEHMARYGTPPPTYTQTRRGFSSNSTPEYHTPTKENFSSSMRISFNDDVPESWVSGNDLRVSS